MTSGRTLLARGGSDGRTIAQEIREAGVDSLNISLDTLDRAVYQRITGRDFLPRVLEGIEAAIEARFPQIKLNAVLMRGRNEDALLALIDFAGKRKLLLRFIELMPISTSEVLTDDNFLSIGHARRIIESRYELVPEKVSIELNRRLLRSERYDTPLKEGDEVEIVTFVGGG